MAIYILVAIPTNLDTLRRIDPKVYQACGILMAKSAFHFFPSPFLGKNKGHPFPHKGTNTPKKTKKGGSSPPLYAWLFCEFKRSMFGYSYI